MTALKVSSKQSFELGFNKACGLAEVGELAAAENELRLAIKLGESFIGWMQTWTAPDRGHTTGFVTLYPSQQVRKNRMGASCSDLWEAFHQRLQANLLLVMSGTVVT